MTPGGGGWGKAEHGSDGPLQHTANGLHSDRRSGSLVEREAASLGA